MLGFGTLKRLIGFGDHNCRCSYEGFGGPVVKTGPTTGNNRSRNNDVRWRRHRSDAGVPRKGQL